MIQQLSIPATAQDRLQSACRHHWIIEPPMGPISRGVCLHCDEVREFKNYIDSAPWSDDPSALDANPRNSAIAQSDEPDEADGL
jgi:hypothetical protein